MLSKPHVGAVTERQFVVEPKHLIDFAEHGMPAVLCTPALVGFLERTARASLAPFLEPDENSVGSSIDIAHVAPTPAGHTVTCLARVIQVDGRRVTFQVKARDPQELIARGVHQRNVVRVSSFTQAVKRRSG
jgi:fluoroacetyl-CoA thioesterase